MNITEVEKEVAPACQAAVNLVNWAEETMCNSVDQLNNRMIVKATPMFLPLKQAIEAGEATKIFQLATLTAQELAKRPEKFPEDHPISILKAEVKKVLHAKKDEETN